MKTHEQRTRIARARLLAQRMWCKACAWDGMPVDTMFAAFSDGNPYALAFDRAAGLLNLTARNVGNEQRKAAHSLRIL